MIMMENEHHLGVHVSYLINTGQRVYTMRQCEGGSGHLFFYDHLGVHVSCLLRGLVALALLQIRVLPCGNGRSVV